jgi:hypothetical protein
MSELEVFRAELERLEQADEWDHPAYDFLAAKVSELQAAERKSQPATTSSQTGSGSPDSDPLQALQTEMRAALANPGKYSDAQRDTLVTRFNTQVIEAGAAGAERVDVGQLARDMVGAGDSSTLTDEQRAELSRRYDQATRQGPERRTVKALRGELAGGDLAARMEAGAVLQQRGELDDGVADALVTEYQRECQAAAERGLDVESLPPELQEPARAILAAQAALEVPADPTEAALAMFNSAVAGMRPPSVAEQLEALGVVQAEPEPEVPEPASQEG